MNNCGLIGDTKVPLLNGTQLSLKELVDERELYVYSLDKDLNLVPGKAMALKVGNNVELMKVTVSGGETIRCEPDYEFMLLDGSYKKAGDLRPFDSLMPLYRTYQSRDGYEHIKAKKAGSTTHKMVIEHFLGKSEDDVIHHKNDLWFDNSPDNLEYKKPGDHSRDHRNKKCIFSEPDFQEKKMKTIRERGFYHTPEGLKKKQEVGEATIRKYMEENPEHFRNAVKDNGKRGAEYLREYHEKKKSVEMTCECGKTSLDKSAHTKHQKHCEIHGNACNHKVLYAEGISYKEDVYCLQIKNYHNFALYSGIFVHALNGK